MKTRLAKQNTILAMLFLCYLANASGVSAQPVENKISGPEATEDKYSESLLKPSLSQFTSAAQQVVSRKSNLLILGAGLAATLAVRPFDDDISSDLREDDLGELEVEVPNTVGSFFVVGASGLVTHLVGRIARKPALANTGLYMFEAVMTTQLVTFIFKKSVGRTRPDGSNDLSFPSGHTSAMTAIAGVLQQRHGWRAGIPAFVLATYVGVTRIKSQKHFASDVLAGATIGTILGASFVPARSGHTSFGLAPLIGRHYAGLYAGFRF